jgi:hypothetical protein
MPVNDLLNTTTNYADKAAIALNLNTELFTLNLISLLTKPT